MGCFFLSTFLIIVVATKLEELYVFDLVISNSDLDHVNLLDLGFFVQIASELSYSNL